MMPDKSQPEITMPCPECGAQLVVRENGKTGEKFLGCSHYPECRHTQPLTEYLKMRQAGYEPLF
ncbi:MAG: topoisomerase DNA-binding C4 zinc finger domain-containing protein [Cyanobacteria bacterium REEB65]|nr:topoisomerase DNA-binding C4 zinc finger domain-containing protein [Cyanobacteria bacterium REEB65]